MKQSIHYLQDLVFDGKCRITNDDDDVTVVQADIICDILTGLQIQHHRYSIKAQAIIIELDVDDNNRINQIPLPGGDNE